jgi:DNA-binding transcriptional LysR family regulator
MLELVHLKTFVVLVATRSFTQTANQLGYSQGSVSHHIQELERELGTTLVDRFRFTRNVQLTAMGRKIHKYALQILALAEETKAAVQKCKRRQAQSTPTVQ